MLQNIDQVAFSVSGKVWYRWKRDDIDTLLLWTSLPEFINWYHEKHSLRQYAMAFSLWWYSLKVWDFAQLGASLYVPPVKCTDGLTLNVQRDGSSVSSLSCSSYTEGKIVDSLSHHGIYCTHSLFISSDSYMWSCLKALAALQKASSLLTCDFLPFCCKTCKSKFPEPSAMEKWSTTHSNNLHTTPGMLPLYWVYCLHSHSSTCKVPTLCQKRCWAFHVHCVLQSTP